MRGPLDTHGLGGNDEWRDWYESRLEARRREVGTCTLGVRKARSDLLENEPEMHAVLRLSLQGVRPPELPTHRGLRIAWIEDALAPLRGEIAEDELQWLIHGIGETLGSKRSSG